MMHSAAAAAAVAAAEKPLPLQAHHTGATKSGQSPGQIVVYYPNTDQLSQQSMGNQQLCQIVDTDSDHYDSCLSPYHNLSPMAPGATTCV